jgi:diguanylate cyclase (GGDEF)-like protein
MTDPRIRQYRDILNAIQEGRTVAAGLPPGPEDDITVLGRSIVGLAEGMAQRFQQDRLLASVSEKILQGLYLKEVLTHVYESFRPLIPYQRLGCAVIETGGQSVRSCWQRSDGMTLELREGYTAKLAGSSLQAVLDSGKPRIINDLEAYLEAHPGSVSTRLIVREGIRSSLTCPLIALGKPVGFLFFSSIDKNCYQSLHQDTFLSLASLISVVVEKSKLYEELYHLNRQLTETRDALQIQATHDALTGVWNRGAIEEILAKQLAQAKRRNGKIAVVLADIDRFKQVNDTHGHPVGDVVLREVARRIQATLRTGDYVGRYGGEEFLILPEVGNAEEAISLTERIRGSIRAEPVDFEGGQLRVTSSFGLAFRSELALDSADTLIAEADRALYEAKRTGRDRVVPAL